MIAFIVILLAVVVLAFFIARKPADVEVRRRPLPRGLEYAALAALGLGVAFWLMMGLGEMIGGDFSGVAHLPAALVAGLLMGLAWRRPWETGLALLALGLTLGVYFFVVSNGFQDGFGAPLLLALPNVFVGGLLTLAAWLARRPPPVTRDAKRAGGRT